MFLNCKDLMNIHPVIFVVMLTEEDLPICTAGRFTKRDGTKFKNYEISLNQTHTHNTVMYVRLYYTCLHTVCPLFLFDLPSYRSDTHTYTSVTPSLCF